SPGVSEALRNQALRRLFRSARFNVIDPLDDYNEDYRSFQALGDLVTSDMRHRMELEKEQAEERAELASDAETPAADTGEEQDDAEGGEQAESGLAAADRDDDRGAGTATEDGRTPESDDSSPSRS
ncbi:MAG TPA: DUF3306 domain-containing protein, partial [Arenicellales bacterium]|nr:DUF3306 domain-containing protein [Arenicellales bacterium]